MADVRTRREARRRKILENSESRLKKITNIDVDDIQDNEFRKPSLKIEEPITHVSPKPNEPEDHPEEQRDNSLWTVYQNTSSEDSFSTMEAEFVNFNQKNLIFRKWFIIILALIVRLLYLITEQLYVSDILVKHRLNMIFLPFIIYQITEYIFFKPPIPRSGLLNFLFMLNVGLRTENIQKLITVCRISLQIVQNLMIYFFVFICFHQIIIIIVQEKL